MKESKDRTEQFMYSAAAAVQHPASSNAPLHSDTLRRRLPAAAPSRADSVLFNPNSRPDSRSDVKGKGRALPDGELLAVDLNSAEAGMANGDGNPFQQMQLVEQQVRLRLSCVMLMIGLTYFFGVSYRTTISNRVLPLSSQLNRPSRS